MKEREQAGGDWRDSIRNELPWNPWPRFCLKTSSFISKSLNILMPDLNVGNFFVECTLKWKSRSGTAQHSHRTRKDKLLLETSKHKQGRVSQMHRSPVAWFERNLPGTEVDGEEREKLSTTGFLEREQRLELRGLWVCCILWFGNWNGWEELFERLEVKICRYIKEIRQAEEALQRVISEKASLPRLSGFFVKLLPDALNLFRALVCVRRLCARNFLKRNLLRRPSHWISWTTRAHQKFVTRSCPRQGGFSAVQQCAERPSACLSEKQASLSSLKAMWFELWTVKVSNVWRRGVQLKSSSWERLVEQKCLEWLKCSIHAIRRGPMHHLEKELRELQVEKKDLQARHKQQMLLHILQRTKMLEWYILLAFISAQHWHLLLQFEY